VSGRACGRQFATGRPTRHAEPMRPILRPGTHVLDRGAGQVQVGLDPDTALVLPGTPPVRDSLRLLTSSADVDAYQEASTLDLLERHGHLIDERDLMPLLTHDHVSPHTTAALARAVGSGVADAQSSRRRLRLQTRTFGPPGASGLGERFVELTGTAGLPGEAARGASPHCGVLLGVGEPDRELVDGWTRSGTPHLLVRLTEGRAVIGPFVVPGETACLRCVDAHCTDADPSWPLLVRQYSAASAADRSDGAPEPVDPLLAALALAWAARDLASYVDGLRPSTWSATVTVHPQLSRLETRPWLRHPACGCSWS
jgi:bacteriocin biosynthesis cyclodehydratase domain-containing protein